MPAAKDKPKSGSKTGSRPKVPSRSTTPAFTFESPAPVEALLAELKTTVDQPSLWLDTPNPLFGGRIPSQLIGTDDEKLLWEWIGSVKHGMVS